MAPTNKIALDTNMLSAIGEFRVDVFEEAKRLLGGAEFYIPAQVSAELDALEKRGRKNKVWVGIARKVMEKNNTMVLEAGGENADDALLVLGRKGFAVATNDRKLRKRLKESMARVIFLRKRCFLEME